MKYSIAFICVIILFGTVFAIAGNVSASPPSFIAPTPTVSGRVATQAELDTAHLEWAKSAHADTFDDSMGANTTCARCKSPRNWDINAPAATQALDCAACKRTPGAPRPDLEGGVPVPHADWKNIGCEVCHQPVGNSYLTAISYWNEATSRHEPVKSVKELCAKCHEGQHGFQVIEEQETSPAHKGWECTRCHGAHGSPSKCTDCHNPLSGKGVEEHARHPETNCTACHDAGGLVIWHDREDGSRHFDEYIPVRFAHALTSWPSHNIQTPVWCGRCHHLRQNNSAPVSSSPVCQECHREGFVMFWCQFFPRDPLPRAMPTRTP